MFHEDGNVNSRLNFDYEEKYNINEGVDQGNYVPHQYSMTRQDRYVEQKFEEVLQVFF